MPAGYVTVVVALPVTVVDVPGWPSNSASTRDTPLVFTVIVRDGRSSAAAILDAVLCPNRAMQWVIRSRLPASRSSRVNA